MIEPPRLWKVAHDDFPRIILVRVFLRFHSYREPGRV
jgi:hypothetical protein